MVISSYTIIPRVKDLSKKIKCFFFRRCRRRRPTKTYATYTAPSVIRYFTRSPYTGEFDFRVAKLLFYVHPQITRKIVSIRDLTTCWTIRKWPRITGILYICCEWLHIGQVVNEMLVRWVRECRHNDTRNNIWYHWLMPIKLFDIGTFVYSWIT